MMIILILIRCSGWMTKAKKVCPDSLALIGIYGSVATGDAYEKSDLDLLILIENNEGWQLGTGFILDDSNILQKRRSKTMQLHRL